MSKGFNKNAELSKEIQVLPSERNISLYNDLALKGSVDAILTKDFWKTEIPQVTTMVLIDGKEYPISRIIAGIQLNGLGGMNRFSDLGNGAPRIEIKSGSNLAKLIQIELMRKNISVQKKDTDSLVQGVDGNIGRFTAQGIKDYIQEYNAVKDFISTATLNLKDEIEARRSLKVSWKEVTTQAAKIASIAVGIPPTRPTISESTERDVHNPRNIEVTDLGNGKWEFASYGQKSWFNLMEKTFSTKLPNGEEFVYPIDFGFHVNNTNIVLTDPKNVKSLEKAMEWVNFIHFTIEHFMKDTGKVHRLNERKIREPFVIRGDQITFDDTNVPFRDTVILKNLSSVQKVAWIQEVLNDLYKKINPETSDTKKVRPTTVSAPVNRK